MITIVQLINISPNRVTSFFVMRVPEISSLSKTQLQLCSNILNTCEN